ncbi:MAG: response regulator [Phycisphaerae bacterium]|nr:response regulator [Phycisphaerae bacterium]
MSTDIVEPTRRILVVEARSEWLEGVARELARVSVTLRWATTENQSLRILKSERPSLALVAADEPRLGGLNLVRRMHLIAENLPVVLIGGRYDRHWLEEALRLKALTILPRPVSKVTVIETVIKALKVGSPVKTPGWFGGASAN